MPKVLDLFSGCGGFSLGAHLAGFSTSLAIDVDPILSSSFEKNFPRTKILRRDIATITGPFLRSEIPDGIDGVIGGPPCQAFSTMGRRDGTDPRRALVAEFFRIVRIIKPKFFVFENVPGLGLDQNISLLHVGLETLPSSWKIIGPQILNSAEFGAATKRKRLFVFGFDTEQMVSPTKEELLGKPAIPGTTVRDAIGDLVSAPEFGFNEHGFDLWKYDLRRAVSDYAERMRSKTGQFTGHRKTQHSYKTLARFADLPPGSTDKVGKNQRLKWEGLCPTLRAGTGSDRGSHQAVRPIHPEIDRVITPREAARLQGFHDDFLFHPTIWHSYRMIGNSVSPIIARELMKRIKKHLNAQQLATIAAD